MMGKSKKVQERGLAIVKEINNEKLFKKIKKEIK